MSAATSQPHRASLPELLALAGSARAVHLRAGRFHATTSGDYLSPFKGRGMEFDESRVYQPGDDIRNIDWRVTARTGTPHTKLFREERERPVFVAVDLRASMFFATRVAFKSVQAVRLAALLAWAAHQQGDRVGGLVFGDQDHAELKPRRGRAAVLRLLDLMAEHPAWEDRPAAAPQPEAVDATLARLRRMVRPGSMLFVVSDFRGFPATAERHLVQLTRHCETTLMHVYDPIEAELPPPGRYGFSNGLQRLTVDTYASR